MTPLEAQSRIAELRAQIARHDELYYRRAKPEIADFDYDALKRELAEHAQVAARTPETQVRTRALNNVKLSELETCRAAYSKLDGSSAAVDLLKKQTACGE